MNLRARMMAASAALLLTACSAPGPSPSESLDGNAAHHVLGTPTGAGTAVEVTVTGSDGRPAAGARVVLGARYSVSSGSCALVGAEKVAEGRTDADGRCLLSIHLSEAVAGIRAAACAGNGVGASVWAERPLGGATPLAVRLGDGIRPRGVVLDLDGRPVPGAAVEAWYGGGNLRVFRAATIAAADGTFLLPPLPREAADDLFVEASEARLGSGGVTPGTAGPWEALRITLNYPPAGHAESPK